jgi:hypothetical protein
MIYPGGSVYRRSPEQLVGLRLPAMEGERVVQLRKARGDAADCRSCFLSRSSVCGDFPRRPVVMADHAILGLLLSDRGCRDEAMALIEPVSAGSRRNSTRCAVRSRRSRDVWYGPVGRRAPPPTQRMGGSCSPPVTRRSQRVLPPVHPSDHQTAEIR